MKELGRALYKLYFYLRTWHLKITSKTPFEIWYRNSLYQDYFGFAQSDIDISLYFDSDKDIARKAQDILKKLSRDPLIKECHFYYPQLVEDLPLIGNIFELKRDPVLLKKFSLREDIKLSEGEKTAYLLRMFFSNLHQLERPSRRDLEKWRHHFLAVGGPIPSDLSDLPALIGKALNQTNEHYLLTLKYLKEAFLEKKELHLIWQDTPFPNETMVLLPHQFCFTGHVPLDLSSREEEVLLAQLSWEIWGMMVSPYLLTKGSPVFVHLEHLKTLLERCLFKEKSSEKKRAELLLALKHWRKLFLD